MGLRVLCAGLAMVTAACSPRAAEAPAAHPAVAVPGDAGAPPGAGDQAASSAAAVIDERWVGQPVSGLPADAALWDVAVGDAGVTVAVGTVPTGDSTVPLIVWRSENRVSWTQVFRYPEGVGEERAYEETRAAVATVGDEFAVVAAWCSSDRCEPLALHSPDGLVWSRADVPVRPPARDTVVAARGGAASVRLVAASPEFTLQGAAMLDVVAASGRLVAVGWAESGRYATAGAVWLSDDGGANWRQAAELPLGLYLDRHQLDRVVAAGDRLVAGGGNRCCYEQTVGEVWVSDAGGVDWYRQALPVPVVLSGLAAVGSDVHVFGAVWESREAFHWRLAGTRWDRRAAPPTGPNLVAAGPEGLSLVAVESTGPPEHQRLVLLQSADGVQWRMGTAAHPRPALTLEAAVVGAGRVRAYAAAGEGESRRHLLFEAPAAAAAVSGRAVWEVRVRPRPVLFGEGVRIPAGDGGFVDVTPPQATLADVVVDAFFVDRDHGWVLLADFLTGRRRVLRTVDGGVGWAPGGFDSEDPARWLYFTDPSHGWLVAPAVGTYPVEDVLYSTTDGGATWTGPTPLPGCGPVAFDTPLRGWRADDGQGYCSGGFHATHDGGATWSVPDVPPPAPPAGRTSRSYGLPRLGGRVLPLRVPGTGTVAFYASADAGRTWEVAATVEFEQIDPNGTPQAGVGGQKAWWAADAGGSEVAVSVDRGRHWRRVRPEGSGGRLVGLEAVDDRRAWAIDSGPAGVRLMQTLDGGAHWRPLVEDGASAPSMPGPPSR